MCTYLTCVRPRRGTRVSSRSLETNVYVYMNYATLTRSKAQLMRPMLRTNEGTLSPGGVRAISHKEPAIILLFARKGGQQGAVRKTKLSTKEQVFPS